MQNNRCALYCIVQCTPFVFNEVILSNLLKKRMFSAIIFFVSGCGAVGSVLPWGGRGRPFKSGHSDQNRSFKIVVIAVLMSAIFLYTFYNFFCYFFIFKFNKIYLCLSPICTILKDSKVCDFALSTFMPKVCTITQMFAIVLNILKV